MDINNDYDLFIEKKPMGGQVFSLFHRVMIPFVVVLCLFSGGSVLGLTGQLIALPLFLSTFGEYAGAYFVIWFCSFCFTIVFGLGAILLTLKGAISREERELKWHPYMFCVGFFDSLNGILVVYSSFLAQVSGPLQAILPQATIPITLVFSYFVLNKKYNLYQCLGALFVLAGILVSLIPVFIEIDEISQGTWWWALILLGAQVPASCMNITQEMMQDKFRVETQGKQKRFSIIYFQAIESSYQFLSMSFFFWTDIIPGFGTTPNLSSFWSSYSFDWKCFLGFDSAIRMNSKCNICAVFGCLFIFCYLCSYVSNTGLTLYSSANTLSLLSTIPPILTVVFWYSFPSVNKWAGGAPYTLTDFLCNFGAIPLLVVGVLLFRLNEREDKRPTQDEGVVEIFW